MYIVAKETNIINAITQYNIYNVNHTVKDYLYPEFYNITNDCGFCCYVFKKRFFEKESLEEYSLELEKKINKELKKFLETKKNNKDFFIKTKRELEKVKEVIRILNNKITEDVIKSQEKIT